MSNIKALNYVARVYNHIYIYDNTCLRHRDLLNGQTIL
jgi:hypothetical protein